MCPETQHSHFSILDITCRNFISGILYQGFLLCFSILGLMVQRHQIPLRCLIFSTASIKKTLHEIFIWKSYGTFPVSNIICSILQVKNYTTLPEFSKTEDRCSKKIQSGYYLLQNSSLAKFRLQFSLSDRLPPSRK